MQHRNEIRVEANGNLFRTSGLYLSTFRICILVFLINATLWYTSAIGSSPENFANDDNRVTRPFEEINRNLETPALAFTEQTLDENGGVSPETFDDYEDYPGYDDFNVSMVAPEVLLDLDPDEMILSLAPGAAQPQGRRKPVPDGFVRKQEMEILRLHNFYRGNLTPPAADMSFMEWDDYLARIAQDWANRCDFRHGFPAHSYPGTVGQNLYMGHDPTGVRAMLLWYEEYQYYDMKTLHCEDNELCGHFTQLAWSESALVGCGMKRCGVRKFYVVCHYSPAGNIGGVPPYKVGKPCSQCPLDHGGLCTDNLCVTEDQCARNKEQCSNPVCPLECYNCGTLNSTSCKCKCADGWDSLDCSRRCRNNYEGCGKKNGYPSVTYCSLDQHSIANVHCREMCGRCRVVVDLNAPTSCCNGLLCDDGYVIEREEDDCKCKLLCPGPECHNPHTPLPDTSGEENGYELKNFSNQARKPQHADNSIQESGTTKRLPTEDNAIMHRNTADVTTIATTLQDSSGRKGTICDDIADDDNGSQRASKSNYGTLLLVLVQTKIFLYSRLQ